jgi:hypothetical protein
MYIEVVIKPWVPRHPHPCTKNVAAGHLRIKSMLIEQSVSTGHYLLVTACLVQLDGSWVDF